VLGVDLRDGNNAFQGLFGPVVMYNVALSGRLWETGGADIWVQPMSN
jgi:hypothetical protein